MEVNNSNDAWLNHIRSFAEREIKMIEEAPTLEWMNIHCHCAVCYLALLVDLRSWSKLDRCSDKAEKIREELVAKMWQAISTHLDWIIADINKRNVL